MSVLSFLLFTNKTLSGYEIFVCGFEESFRLKVKTPNTHISILCLLVLRKKMDFLLSELSVGGTWCRIELQRWQCDIHYT